MNVIRRLLIITLALSLIAGGYLAYNHNKQTVGIVRAFGNIIVTFPSSPMFNEVNWLPGKSVAKSIFIENDSIAQKVGIKAENIVTNGQSPLSDVLTIIVSQNGNPLYGAGSSTGIKTLSDFYKEDVVWLSKVNFHEKAKFDFTISMDLSAGNSYQGESTGFDLLAGSDSELLPNLKVLPTLKPLPTIRPLRPLKSLPTLPPLPAIPNIPSIRGL